MNELGGRRNGRSYRDVWRIHWAEQVLNFSNFLEFGVANFRSEFDETGFVAFDYEASALRQVKNFPEPPQTLFVTPVVVVRECHSIFKRTYLSNLSNGTKTYPY